VAGLRGGQASGSDTDQLGPGKQGWPMTTTEDGGVGSERVVAVYQEAGCENGNHKGTKWKRRRRKGNHAVSKTT
jgi:hypothetical protein